MISTHGRKPSRHNPPEESARASRRPDAGPPGARRVVASKLKGDDSVAESLAHVEADRCSSDDDESHPREGVTAADFRAVLTLESTRKGQGRRKTVAVNRSLNGEKSIIACSGKVNRASGAQLPSAHLWESSTHAHVMNSYSALERAGLRYRPASAFKRDASVVLESGGASRHARLLSAVGSSRKVQNPNVLMGVGETRDAAEMMHRLVALRRPKSSLEIGPWAAPTKYLFTGKDTRAICQASVKKNAVSNAETVRTETQGGTLQVQNRINFWPIQRAENAQRYQCMYLEALALKFVEEKHKIPTISPHGVITMEAARTLGMKPSQRIGVIVANATPTMSDMASRMCLSSILVEARRLARGELDPSRRLISRRFGLRSMELDALCHSVLMTRTVDDQFDSTWAGVKLCGYMACHVEGRKELQLDGASCALVEALETYSKTEITRRTNHESLRAELLASRERTAAEHHRHQTRVSEVEQFIELQSQCEMSPEARELTAFSNCPPRYLSNWWMIEARGDDSESDDEEWEHVFEVQCQVHKGPVGFLAYADLEKYADRLFACPLQDPSLLQAVVSTLKHAINTRAPGFPDWPVTVSCVETEPRERPSAAMLDYCEELRRYLMHHLFKNGGVARFDDSKEQEVDPLSELDGLDEAKDLMDSNEWDFELSSSEHGGNDEGSEMVSAMEGEMDSIAGTSAVGSVVASDAYSAQSMVDITSRRNAGAIATSSAASPAHVAVSPSRGRGSRGGRGTSRGRSGRSRGRGAGCGVRNRVNNGNEPQQYLEDGIRILNNSNNQVLYTLFSADVLFTGLAVARALDHQAPDTMCDAQVPIAANPKVQRIATDYSVNIRKDMLDLLDLNKDKFTVAAKTMVAVDQEFAGIANPQLVKCHAENPVLAGVGFIRPTYNEAAVAHAIKPPRFCAPVDRQQALKGESYHSSHIAILHSVSSRSLQHEKGDRVGMASALSLLRMREMLACELEDANAEGEAGSGAIVASGSSYDPAISMINPKRLRDAREQAARRIKSKKSDAAFAAAQEKTARCRRQIQTIDRILDSRAYLGNAQSPETSGLARSWIVLRTRMKLYPADERASQPLVAELVGAWKAEDDASSTFAGSSGEQSVSWTTPKVITQVPSAERIEAHPQPVPPQELGLRMSSSLGTWQADKCRKDTPTRWLQVVPADYQPMGGQPPPPNQAFVGSYNPPPICLVTEATMRSEPSPAGVNMHTDDPSNADASDREAKDNNSHLFSLSLQIVGNGAVRLCDVLREMLAYGRSSVVDGGALTNALSLLTVGMIHISYMGEIFASQACDGINNAIANGKRIYSCDNTFSDFMTAACLFFAGRGAMHPSCLGTRWEGQTGSHVDHGITPPGIDCKNYSDGRLGADGGMCLSTEAADEITTELAKHFYVDMNDGTFDARPSEARGIPWALIPGVHSALRKYVEATESARHLTGMDSDAWVTEVLVLPVTPLAEQKCANCREGDHDAAYRWAINPRRDGKPHASGKSYLTDSTDEADAITSSTRCLISEPSIQSSLDNPFATPSEEIQVVVAMASYLAALSKMLVDRDVMYEDGTTGPDTLQQTPEHRTRCVDALKNALDELFAPARPPGEEAIARVRAERANRSNFAAEDAIEVAAEGAMRSASTTCPPQMADADATLRRANARADRWDCCDGYALPLAQRHIIAAHAAVAISCIYPYTWYIDEPLVQEDVSNAIPLILNQPLDGTQARRIVDVLSTDEAKRAIEWWAPFARDDPDKSAWTKGPNTGGLAPLIEWFVEFDGQHDITDENRHQLREALHDAISSAAYLACSPDGVNACTRPGCPVADIQSPMHVRRDHIDPIFVRRFGEEVARGPLVGCPRFNQRNLLTCLEAAHIDVTPQAWRIQGAMVYRVSAAADVLTPSEQLRPDKQTSFVQQDRGHQAYGTVANRRPVSAACRSAWDKNALHMKKIWTRVDPPLPASRRSRGDIVAAVRREQDADMPRSECNGGVLHDSANEQFNDALTAPFAAIQSSIYAATHSQVGAPK